MSEDDGREAFLDRWSRLKREQPKPAEPPAAIASKEEGAAPPLPPVGELKADSDYTPFMDPKVDPSLRRDALKRLFAGGEFNAADPFEPYSGDLTGGEPIPEAMLKTLNHVKRVLFDDSQKDAAAQAAESPQPLPQAQPTETKNAAGSQDV